METVEKLAGQLERLTGQLRRASRDKHCGLDVTPGQLRVLRVLSQGDRSYRIKDLAESLCIVPRSATSAVDELESLGYVARAADPDDRRAIQVRMTDKGEALLLEVRQRKSDATAALLGRLTTDEQEQLVGLLDRLVPDHPTGDGRCH